MFQEFNIAPVGNSSGGITLQQQCSGSLEGLSYTEGFQSREEWHSHVSIISHLHWQGNNRNFNLIPWALHRQNLYCNLEPFPYGLRVKLQSQTRTIRMWNTPALWGKPCTTSCLLVLMGMRLYKQAVNLGNPVAQGSLTSGKNESGFLFNQVISE